MDSTPRRQTSPTSNISSPDREITHSFDEYAQIPEPYPSYSESLDSDQTVFVPASELAETSQVYRHAALHTSFLSPFVRLNVSSRSLMKSCAQVTDAYSSSPSTSFFGKQSYSASPPMLSGFTKSLEEYHSSPRRFDALHSPSTSAIPSDPYFQESNVPPVVRELYHKVNPYFATKAQPVECLQFFAETMRTLGFQYTIRQNWTILVVGLLCVEEVTFTISLKQGDDHLVVDFNLHQGSERNFLRLFDIVRNYARSLDLHPESVYSTSAEWLNVDSMPELFPGSSQVSKSVLLEYCEDYMLLAEEIGVSTRGDQARLEMAVCIKNACLSEKTRQLISQDADVGVMFSKTVYRMAHDEQIGIVRFAVFILSLFDMPTLVHLASQVQGEDNMLSVLKDIETHDPIPKMKSIAETLRSKLVATN
ncbi:unnamed protein product [Aphanomyces euteiches]